MGTSRRRRFAIAITMVVAIASLGLVLRSRTLHQPAEHSASYHLDPTDLATSASADIGPGVRILCYHYFRRDFDPIYLVRVFAAVVLGMPALGPQEFWTMPISQFERHLRYFRDEHIPVLTLGDIAAYQARGEALPDPAVVITIDDADRSVYRLAWPLLKRYGMRAHLFVPTSEVGLHWSGIDVCTWAELREMGDSGVLIVGSHTHDLHYKVATDAGRQPVFWNPQTISTAQRTEELAELRAIGTAPDHSDANAAAPPSDPIAADLLLSRRLVERHIGKSCLWLAWPYGFGSGRLDSLAARVGFHGTLSLRPRSVEDDSPPWHLGRFTLTAKTTPQEVAAFFVDSAPF